LLPHLTLMPNPQPAESIRLKILSILPADLPVTDLQGEQELLTRLADSSDENSVEIFWRLVHFYRVAEKNDLACKLINNMLEADDSVENKAYCYLVLGQIAEVRQQFDAAIDFYTRGLTSRTPNKVTKYFLYNNTAYCLNTRGMYKAAESYSRSAIELNPARANGFKNLGVSLEGQNNLVGAAWAYVEGVRADSRDPRCLELLKKLVAGHPELAAQFTLLLEHDTSDRVTQS